jgi:hypothetical protein
VINARFMEFMFIAVGWAGLAAIIATVIINKWGK